MNDAAASARESAYVHWLFLGSLSDKPSGRRFPISPDDFAEAFAAAGLSAKVDVGPALGAAGAVEIELKFDTLKSYAIKHLLAAAPLLGELRKLADALGGPASKRPEPDAAVAKVVELIGDGPLASELRKLFAGEDAEGSGVSEGGGSPTPTADAGLVDELLDANKVSGESGSSKAVSSFISAMRGQKAKTSGKKAVSQSRQARDMLETAVFGATNAILQDPGVTGPESIWRGFKLMTKQCPHRAKMHIEVVDVGLDGIEAALDACLDDEAMNRPDLFLVFDRCEDVGRLRALASKAEDMHTPLIASVGPGFFGAEDAHDVLQTLRDAKPDAGAAMPEGWADLTQDEVSRWLSVATNDVAVASEGVGSARRSVLGNPVFAIGAMLASSFARTSGFAQVLGKTGSLKVPGLIEVSKGSQVGITVPTAAFLPIRGQEELADLGIIGLGSGRNSDAVMLSKIPTARTSKDAFPLPAQLLTGRLVRFATWVCDQVPAGTPRAQVADLFKEAGSIFLFPGLSEGADLEAAVVDGADGPMIRLVASVQPRFAGIPFEVGFDLPLSVALGD